MLLKGTQIGITGEFCLRQYQGKDGTEKTSADLRVSDVTLLGKSSDSGSVHETRTEQKPERKAHATDFDDEDIPFANPYRGRACYVV